MHGTGYPVFNLKIADTTMFTPPHFTTYMADFSKSGWYGFPAQPEEHVIKLARRSDGNHVHPAQERQAVSDVDIRKLHLFLESTFPALQSASIQYTRVGVTTALQGTHLLIDNHPTKSGLTVAIGGHGHGFKFAPILGELIADTLIGLPTFKFRWREAQPAVAESASFE